jgi:hypothetical protein
MLGSDKKIIDFEAQLTPQLDADSENAILSVLLPCCIQLKAAAKVWSKFRGSAVYYIALRDRHSIFSALLSIYSERGRFLSRGKLFIAIADLELWLQTQKYHRNGIRLLDFEISVKTIAHESKSCRCPAQPFLKKPELHLSAIANVSPERMIRMHSIPGQLNRCNFTK